MTQPYVQSGLEEARERRPPFTSTSQRPWSGVLLDIAQARDGGNYAKVRRNEKPPDVLGGTESKEVPVCGGIGEGVLCSRGD